LLFLSHKEIIKMIVFLYFEQVIHETRLTIADKIKNRSRVGDFLREYYEDHIALVEPEDNSSL